MGLFSQFLREEMTQKGVSAAKLSEAIGKHRSQVSGYLKGTYLPKEATLLKIADTLNVPIEYLRELTAKNTKVPFHQNLKQNKLEQTPTGMPVFESAPMTLSNIESYRDDPRNEPDFWLSIPQYRKCNYACRAKGDSMYPIVRNHALVGGREITDLSLIVFGDIYIVHTKNGIETIKYINPDPENDDRVLLVPYNQQAKATPIYKADIIRLYIAEFVINPL